jgi:hypothetical protein
MLVGPSRSSLTSVFHGVEVAVRRSPGISTTSFGLFAGVDGAASNLGLFAGLDGTASIVDFRFFAAVGFVLFRPRLPCRSHRSCRRFLKSDTQSSQSMATYESITFSHTLPAGFVRLTKMTFPLPSFRACIFLANSRTIFCKPWTLREVPMIIRISGPLLKSNGQCWVATSQPPRHACPFLAERDSCLRISSMLGPAR